MVRFFSSTKGTSLKGGSASLGAYPPPRQFLNLHVAKLGNAIFSIFQSLFGHKEQSSQWPYLPCSVLCYQPFFYSKSQQSQSENLFYLLCIILCYCLKTKRKTTKTTMQQCFSYQNKSVYQKSDWSCKKLKSAQNALYALFAWKLSIATTYAAQNYWSGLKVNHQLVPHATRFLAVRLKNYVWSHHRAFKATLQCDLSIAYSPDHTNVLRLININFKIDITQLGTK